MEYNCQLKNAKYSEDPRLDLEFRQILCVIKQFILQINSTRHLSLCRSWLEKLNLETCNKNNRNTYLIELAKQIQANALAPPFDQEPCSGPLRPFPEYSVDICHNIREVHSEEFQPNSDEDFYTAPIEERPRTVQCYTNTPPACFPRRKARNFNQNIESKDNLYYPCQEEPFVKKLSDESSWCDLTDISSTSINPVGAGDARAKYFYHKPIMDDCNNDEPKKPTGSDSQDKKLSLKETKFIPADWKVTIESLQLRLTETLGQNNELKSLVEDLNSKLANEKQLRQELEVKFKKSEVHDKQIEITTDNQLHTIQKAYESEIEQHYETSELKIEEIKASYELKLNQIKVENETFKIEKEKEISRLSEIIQQQCCKMTDEIFNLRKEVEQCIVTRGDDKINVLKKCISKMDKLFHKSEREYLKQIEKLKQDLELKEKVQQIQMITQRAEIAARTSAEKQKQVDDIMNNLEVKYIKMLEFHEKQVMDCKKHDDERIEYLSELLRKHNIPFNIF